MRPSRLPVGADRRVSTSAGNSETQDLRYREQADLADTFDADEMTERLAGLAKVLIPAS